MSEEKCVLCGISNPLEAGGYKEDKWKPIEIMPYHEDERVWESPNSDEGDRDICVNCSLQVAREFAIREPERLGRSIAFDDEAGEAFAQWCAVWNVGKHREKSDPDMSELQVAEKVLGCKIKASVDCLDEEKILEAIRATIGVDVEW